MEESFNYKYNAGLRDFRDTSNLFETLKTDSIPWKKYDIKKIEGEADTYRVRIRAYR